MSFSLPENALRSGLPTSESVNPRLGSNSRARFRSSFASCSGPSRCRAAGGVGSVQQLLGAAGVKLWDRDKPPVAEPIAPCGGRQKNVRFALYRDDNRLALHAVNYNVCLLDPQKRILDVEPIDVRLPLPPDRPAVTATCFDPDAEPQDISCRVADGIALLTLPKLHVYQVVIVQRQN